MKRTPNQAFTLIECAMVVVIIAILIVGVIQEHKIIFRAKISAAQAITKSSPVHNAKNLLVWYETSLSSSFIESEIKNNSTISTWYNVNSIALASNKNTAIQATSDNRPKYNENVFDGLPGIKFDGSNDYLSFDGSSLANTNFTVFVVEQQDEAATGQYFLGGDSGSSNYGLYLGYNSSCGTSSVLFGSTGNSDCFDFPAAATPVATPRIHTFFFSQTSGKKYWFNGGITADDTNSSSTTVIASDATATLGALVGSYYFKGYIAELIIFTRDLKDEERQEIEDYLSQKYNIKIL